jgi:hypothetical protein
MVTIIAGSRDFAHYDYMERALEEVDKYAWNITEVVSGGAPGADSCGEAWANDNEVRLTRMPAEWNKYGKSAGYRRNYDMANYAEALIAFWDGKSKGTKHMIDIATQLGLYTKVFRYEQEL